MAKKKMWPWIVGGSLGALLLGGLAYAMMGGDDSGDGGGGGDDAGGGGGGGGDDAGGGDLPDPVFPVYDKPALLEEALLAAGLHKDWVTFYLGVAANESGFQSNVVLGDPSIAPAGSKPSSRNADLGMAESAAAKTAFQRAIEQGRLDCEYPATRYTYGSAGWFAMLPANALAAYDKTSLSCRDPWLLLHPADQVVCAIEFARRLLGWPTYKANPTFLTLRQGWANPSRMDDPAAIEAMRAKFGKHLGSIGIGASFMDKKPPALPAKDVVSLHTKLLGLLK